MERILILYRELAGYFIDCVEHLCAEFSVEADIVAYPVNREAPFQFSTSPKVKVINRHSLSESDLNRMAGGGEYKLIFCGGWSDKAYLKALKHRSCKALLGFDNAWAGTPKQRLAVQYARYAWKPLFDYAFVPGSRQAEFARRMGFAADAIFTGAYSCQVSTFAELAGRRSQRPASNAKRLLYVGRYTAVKCTDLLFEVWRELDAEGVLDGWTLHAVGTGDLFEDRPLHPAIVHHGFLQPDELLALMEDGDAFVLPSRFEPWGVVVHEFAAAGYPLILSDAVNAGEAFLTAGKNGFRFTADRRDELRNALLAMISTGHAERLKMGEESLKRAHTITPALWAQTVYGMFGLRD